MVERARCLELANPANLADLSGQQICHLWPSGQIYSKDRVPMQLKNASPTSWRATTERCTACGSFTGITVTAGDAASIQRNFFPALIQIRQLGQER